MDSKLIHFSFEMDNFYLKNYNLKAQFNKNIMKFKIKLIKKILYKNSKLLFFKFQIENNLSII